MGTFFRGKPWSSSFFTAFDSLLHCSITACTTSRSAVGKKWQRRFRASPEWSKQTYQMCIAKATILLRKHKWYIHRDSILPIINYIITPSPPPHTHTQNTPKISSSLFLRYNSRVQHPTLHNCETSNSGPSKKWTTSVLQTNPMPLKSVSTQDR